MGTTLFGIWMLFQNPAYLFLPWMWLKLIAVVVLIAYHFYCQLILKRQQKGIFLNTSFQLRLFNELATVLLVAIVFLVVIKSSSGLLWGLLGLFAFAGTLMVAVLVYRKAKSKSKA
ncbi:MAG: hypothetical protein EBU33_00655 [Sphingobacteriia bacterium]|nr:hypothetical protein [Sphingobacteriia bacterium]